MNTTPDLIRVSLCLFEDTIAVQGILLQGHVPSELNFDHKVGLVDLPYLDPAEASSHLSALLYDIPDSSSEMHKLEKLIEEGTSYGIGIFSEPNRGFGKVYLLVHCNGSYGLGRHFTGARFGLFLYQYSELLGDDIRNYISYIRIMKISKANFVRKTQDMYRDIEEKKEEKKYYEEIEDYLRKRSGKLKEELKTAKLAIQQLNYQLEKRKTQMKDRHQQSLECFICKVNLKNIVFLPCGHLIMCKDCLIETMHVTPNTILIKNHNLINCPMCNNPVKESKEVHF